MQFVTVQEAAERMKIPVSWFYGQTRRNALPGLVRAGRYVRVDWDALVAALRVGEENVAARSRKE